VPPLPSPIAPGAVAPRRSGGRGAVAQEGRRRGGRGAVADEGRRSVVAGPADSPVPGSRRAPATTTSEARRRTRSLAIAGSVV
jgi:hypothetical protein